MSTSIEPPNFVQPEGVTFRELQDLLEPAIAKAFAIGELRVPVRPISVERGYDNPPNQIDFVTLNPQKVLSRFPMVKTDRAEIPKKAGNTVVGVEPKVYGEYMDLDSGEMAEIEKGVNLLATRASQRIAWDCATWVDEETGCYCITRNVHTVLRPDFYLFLKHIKKHPRGFGYATTEDVPESWELHLGFNGGVAVGMTPAEVQAWVEERNGSDKAEWESRGH